MIGNGVEVFYLTQPVDSADQEVSLAEYLNQHGLLAYRTDGADHAVEVPLECPRREDAAEKASTVHLVVSTWKMFWEHSDKGLFGLPIYQRD